MRFYQFLGCHSLLIGLLPFYLPVFLWGNGHGLAQICLLIGVSGLSFCAALKFWQPLSTRRSTAWLFSLTFGLECLLVAIAITQFQNTPYLIALGICNGVYNAFFWTTQRTLFLQILGGNDSGRQYGNFQIFVSVFLKLGILVGGWLLARDGALALLLISALLGLIATFWFYRFDNSVPLHSNEPISLKQSLMFKDKHNSRAIFVADGFFLFLESHVWSLSLFIIAEEDYARFGVVVVVLAVVFGLLFYVLKNTIDRIAGQFVFRLAVLLYGASWLLRIFADNGLPAQILLILLVCITFCSSFFRLAFNKRFFDIAGTQQGVRYLLIKSYITQFWLGIGFLLLAAVLWGSNISDTLVFTLMYVSASILSLIYLGYRLRVGPKDAM